MRSLKFFELVKTFELEPIYVVPEGPFIFKIEVYKDSKEYFARVFRKERYQMRLPDSTGQAHEVDASTFVEDIHQDWSIFRAASIEDAFNKVKKTMEEIFASCLNLND